MLISRFLVDFFIKIYQTILFLAVFIVDKLWLVIHNTSTIGE